MTLTVLGFYHNFLFVNSTVLSYVYGFGAYGIGLVVAGFDTTVRRLLAIGTIGGFVELLGDHFLVHVADTLVYPTGYPFLLSSPAYMPFAWAVLIAFMGYLALRLGEISGPLAGYIGPAVVAFVSESGYESFASQGGGWVYTTAPLGWLGEAPLFILVAEAAMFATAYYWMRRGTLTAGIGMGVSINLSYVAAYSLFVLVGSVV